MTPNAPTALTGPVLVAQGCRYRARWARRLPVWDLVLSPGDVAHLVGPNGTGKSTYLRAIVGLEPAAWGRRVVGGASASAASTVRYLPSGGGPSVALGVGDYLALLARRRAVSPVQQADAVDRWHLGHLLGQRTDRLSQGERRAVSLAAALAGLPVVVVLDEPMVGLDADRRVVLATELRRALNGGAGVLLTGHERWLQAELGGIVISGG